MNNLNQHTQQLVESSYYRNLRMRTIMVGEAKWKPVELPGFKSNVASLDNYRDYYHDQSLERCRDGDSYHIPFN